MTTKAKPADHGKHKLETIFHEDYVIHTTYEPDLEAGEPGKNVEVKKKWTLGETIGSGGFGVVLLQKEEKGQLRAVKRLHRDLMSPGKIDFFRRELDTLAALKAVGVTSFLTI